MPSNSLGAHPPTWFRSWGQSIAHPQAASQVGNQNPRATPTSLTRAPRHSSISCSDFINWTSLKPHGLRRSRPKPFAKRGNSYLLESVPSRRQPQSLVSRPPCHRGEEASRGSFKPWARTLNQFPAVPVASAKWSAQLLLGSSFVLNTVVPLSQGGIKATHQPSSCRMGYPPRPQSWVRLRARFLPDLGQMLNCC